MTSDYLEKSLTWTNVQEVIATIFKCEAKAVTEAVIRRTLTVKPFTALCVSSINTAPCTYTWE